MGFRYKHQRQLSIRHYNKEVRTSHNKTLNEHRDWLIPQVSAKQTRLNTLSAKDRSFLRSIGLKVKEY